MPLRRNAAGRAWRSHDFRILRDAARLRAAVTVSVHITTHPLTAHATLSTATIGHAFPTGDLFRQAVWEIEIDRRPETLRAVRLTRHYTRAPDGRRTSIADTRLPAPGSGPARTLHLRLPEAPVGTRLRWRLVHLRMPDDMAHRFGVSSADNRTLVSEGEAYVPGQRSGVARTTPPP